MLEGGQAAVVEDGGIGAEGGGEAFEVGDEVEGHDAGRASTHGNPGVGVGADEQDGFNSGLVEREEIAFVLQQDGAFACGLQGDFVVRCVVD